MSAARLIFGGSKGIGSAICRRFLQSDDHVVILSRSAENIDCVIEELKNAGDGASRLHGFQCDVSQPSEIKNCVEHVCKTIGKISVLVNSAGVNADHLLMTAPDDLIHDLIKTNLIGSINTCRAVLKPMMRQKSGCIINIGSVIGTHGRAGQSVYSASKAGLVGLTKSLAQEAGSRGVRVNLIAPGLINTEMTERLTDVQALMSRVALRRLGQPDDVADAAEFLVKATYVTGQVITVDGGLALI
ncbi:hypothetical protein CAPTEDRAFT_160055 [Capitella teleta]|uniref:3-ketoacyl-[acyl-carrier-protein] reductase beta subunit n=1 Tax=Capitella teleta TaxID=283909 RepID=R7TL92_CAPTE|nr:hypothetical protein CAPTEDRAFT_160055 [Capitella teleta]|eukprot:ELT94618.1 hypothetical protein CAPTEDRAFT_160055 [Capitella teleta]